MIRSIILALLAGCSYGILSTFVKLAYKDGFTLGDVTGTQAFFGMIILWIIVLLGNLIPQKSKKRYPKMKLNHFGQLLIAGMATCLVSICYYRCVQETPASIAIVLLMQFVWMSMLIDFVVFKKKPTSQQLIAIVIILAGTVLAAGVLNGNEIQLTVSGVLFGLLAAFFYAIVMIVSGRVGVQFKASMRAAVMITGATALVFSLFTPYFLFNGSLSNGLLKYGLILSIFGTVLPPLLFAIAIPKIGPSLGGILSSVELPTAVIAAFILLNENVSWIQIIGVVLILSAIVFTNLPSRKKTTQELRSS